MTGSAPFYKTSDGVLTSRVLEVAREYLQERELSHYAWGLDSAFQAVSPDKTPPEKVHAVCAMGACDGAFRQLGIPAGYHYSNCAKVLDEAVRKSSNGEFLSIIDYVWPEPRTKEEVLAVFILAEAIAVEYESGIRGALG